MNIGDKIREARISKGYTQEELGNLIGVQKSAIAKYENGRVVNIKRSTLQKIAEVLNIRPSELIFEKVPSGDVNLHVRIITDSDLMESLQIYYELSQDKQKMIRDLIHSLHQ
jgi:transcriptional regulator with XRE-family HTH domain